MHPYTMLKEMLRDVGAEPSSEDQELDAFGGCVAIYANGRRTIRLVWDGKDGWGLVQQCDVENEWTDATEPLTEGDLEGVPQNLAKIDRFMKVVAKLLQ
jgi:hypothetical protein